jgi:hypothetical protein
MKNKELIVVLGGRGPNAPWLKKRFKSYFDGSRDLAISTRPQYVKEFENLGFTTIEQPPKPANHNMVAIIRNQAIRWAVENDYGRIWIMDDDLNQITRSGYKEAEDKWGVVEPDADIPFLPSEHPFTKLPVVYGGLNNGNFVNQKLKLGKVWCTITPYSAFYFDIANAKKHGLYEEIMAVEYPWMWEDFDMRLRFRRLGHKPLVPIAVSHKRPTQNMSLDGNSLASSRAVANTLSYNCYVKHGDLNLEVEYIPRYDWVNTPPNRNANRYLDVQHKHPIDCMENFVASVKAEYEKTKKIITAPVGFKFGK